ncbi:taurine dioxygenase family [Fusarium mexicanum]|uniref:Taurine dioxygenase family n=1 Tax=Fusarium mexicanum TaxID=751941 RepID=A0A8H5I8M2_9HYPO|nr:taurine dioxygenase family [Fusarium mexicanum]
MGSISTLTRLGKTGGLDEKFRHEDVTPIIGREYAQVSLVHDILESPNADDLVRNLAITGKRSEQVIPATGLLIRLRACWQYRREASFLSVRRIPSAKKSRYLMQRIGELTGKPATSGLHVHPVMNSAGAGDAEISRIDSRTLSTLYKPNGAVGGGQALPTQASPSRPWHSDGPFEVVTPSRRYTRRGRPPVLRPFPNGKLQFWELSSTGNGFQPHARVIAT